MDSADRTRRFAHWVFWTGVFNIVAYIPFTCPYTLQRFYEISNNLSRSFGLGGTLLTVPVDVNFMLAVNMLGAVVVLLGIMLVIASLNIELRAWFVFYEGLTRFVAFGFIFYFVLFKSADQILFLYGLIDLVIGVVYMYYIFTIDDLRITSPLV
jgi:hypothetical protein